LAVKGHLAKKPDKFHIGLSKGQIWPYIGLNQYLLFYLALLDGSKQQNQIKKEHAL